MLFVALALTLGEELWTGDLEPFVADFRVELCTKDLAPFVTDFTRRVVYKTFSDFCR